MTIETRGVRRIVSTRAFLLMSLLGLQLVWLSFLARNGMDTFLDSDTRDQMEPIFDRANRPGAPEHMPIYGERFSPGLISATLWLSRVLPPRQVMSVANTLTILAALVTVGSLFLG